MFLATGSTESDGTTASEAISSTFSSPTNPPQTSTTQKEVIKTTKTIIQSATILRSTYNSNTYSYL